MALTNKSITNNTIFLYLRLFITVFISFFTQRVVLKALGVEDYGVYNVVGGIITILGILNAGMIQATQRFYAFEIGKKNNSRLKNVFQTSFTIHIFLACLVFIIAELIGVWFLNSHLNIAPDRIWAANNVLQATLFTLLYTIIVVPFDAMIISNEDFNIYAYISILECFLKLLIALIILKAESLDRLILYSWLLFFVSFITKSISIYYNKKHYESCIIRFRLCKKDMKAILSFASYSFIGNIGFILRNQGVNILINIFFGTAINAARGVAYQVTSQISSFSGNFQMAAIPQITKNYSSGEYDRMVSLILNSVKFSFILLFIIALPIILKPIPLLQIWLGEYPQYAEIFLKLALIVSIIDSMSIPIGKGIDATGNIKFFQISICILMLLDIPISYILLSFGGECYIVMIVSIFTSILGMLLRLIILHYKRIGFTFKDYLLHVLKPCITISIISFIPIYYIKDCFNDDVLSYILYIISSIVLIIIISYVFGFNKTEREHIIKQIYSFIHK